tara:strand:- start:1087 stop:1470 length:384 start_codon:yes stop_codon:yes gene_type:complete
MKDNTLKKSIYTSDNENYNLKNKLLIESKIDKDFLNKLQFLKLEELITLKLLVSTNSLRGKLFNFPIFKYCRQICREAVFKYALSSASNRKEASLILGIKKADMKKYIKDYNLEEEFYYGRRTEKSK